MDRGLQGIRVIEIAGGVGVAYAAKLFADLGADVIRVESRNDTHADVVRVRPHEIHRWLNTNKRSVFDSFQSLIADADVLLHDHGPLAAESAGLGFANLAKSHGALVVCSITPFGMTGPYANYVAEEINVIHGSSWGNMSPSAATDATLPPLKAPGHHATINAATIAATAALSAFTAAQRTGRGTHVDFSVFAAAAKMTETAPVSALYHEVDPTRLGVKFVVPWNIFECADGLVQFICPEETQWRSFVTLMGAPEWSQLEFFNTAVARHENADLLNVYLGDWMATQRVNELYVAAQAARVCISPVSTMAQLDANPHFAARNFFAETPDGLRLPGPGFKGDRGWWALRRSAPSPGQHTGQRWSPPSVVADSEAAPDMVGLSNSQATADGHSVGAKLASTEIQRPLTGVRVCDFSWIWAGPFCTQILAHLGADVIKLESPEHLCLFRRLPYAPNGMALTPDTAGAFHLYNTDKRSVGIDLGNDRSRAIVERLVKCSDVVVDNFAVGTLARLGYGPDELRVMNPNVIVVSLSGYGQSGPAKSYMAYGPAGGAVAGLYAANGYEGCAAAETGIAVGDPGAGLTAAWAVVAALSALRNHGEVGTVDGAMVEAVAATVGEPWMEYITTGNVPLPSGNHDALWSPHQCYAASGIDQWVTIACTSEESWRSLCSVVDPLLATDARFVTSVDRKRNEEELDAIIGAWTRSRDRWSVTELLQAVNVAAFPSLSPRDLWTGDPQLLSIGMLEQPLHGVVGRRTLPGVPWLITPGPNGLRRAAPMLGEHTDEVLTEVLGYSAEEVQELINMGAVRRAAKP
jgi:crotonobetainyl-CoA:carnitine CoA-transferase CaiB-like acyl-CoA transferase